MITRHDQMMLATLQKIANELKRANDLKEKELELKTNEKSDN